MAKQTKYVFQDNDAIAHLWIGHNLSGEGQSEARTPRRNFYFENETIYSYGTHFPIARFVRNGKKQAIHFTTGKYSHTTGGHISTVWSAIQGNKIPVFNLKNTQSCGTVDDLNDYLSRINLAIADQTKARSTHNMLRARGTAVDTITESKAFCKFWKIKFPKFPKVPDLPADFKDRQAREKEREAKRDAARAERSRIQREQWAKENAARIARDTTTINEWNENFEVHVAEWLSGGSLNQPITHYYYGDSDAYPKMKEVPTLLRIVGDNVETSRHAIFPVAHAKRGLTLVRATMARGTDWIANGHTCKLGMYAISKITADGTVFAGCHVVPFSSIARIANDLDAYTVANSEQEAN